MPDSSYFNPIGGPVGAFGAFGPQKPKDMSDDAFYTSPSFGQPMGPGGPPPIPKTDLGGAVSSFLQTFPSYYKQIGEGLADNNKTNSQTQKQSLGYGPAITPLETLTNFISGRGGLQASDETGSININPGGSISVTNKAGFNVSAIPAMKSLGVNVPVNVDGTKGVVGLQGSWNQYNPSIQANFAFGQKPFPVSEEMRTTQATSAVEKAISPWQTADPYGTSPELSPRQQVNQLIDQYRSSGGRDPNNPATWWKGY